MIESLVRPYVYQELPGWGRVYRRFVGGYKNDARWSASGTRHIRGKLHGYDMELDLGHWSQRSTYFLGRHYDLPTQQLCQLVLRPGDRMCDVGANIGMITLLAAHLVGTAGRVDAFEPNPVCIERLRETLENNHLTNVFVHQVGLSDRPGTLTLSVPNVNTGEASLAPSQYPPGEIRKVSVEVCRADDIIGASRPPQLVKIDVEGFECLVLDGLQQTLEVAHPIVATEVVPAHLKRAGFSTEDLFERMRTKGYTPYVMTLRRSGLKHVLSLRRAWNAAEASGDVAWIHHPSHGHLPVMRAIATS